MVHALGQHGCSQARRKPHVRGVPKSIERESLRRSPCLRFDPEYIPMSNEVDSSSEGMRSDGDSIATGMMHLAIACTHVQRQSEEEAEAAGN